MIAPADPAAAIAVYLKSEISDLVDGRIFRPELPDGEARSMPRACIVVSRSGGYSLFGGSNPPLGDPRLDLRCYGETWLEAEQIAAAIVPALRSLRTSTWSWTDENAVEHSTRLYWAKISAGPIPGPEDPETNWPSAFVSAQVAHLELAVS